VHSRVLVFTYRLRMFYCASPFSAYRDL